MKDNEYLMNFINLDNNGNENLEKTLLKMESFTKGALWNFDGTD